MARTVKPAARPNRARLVAEFRQRLAAMRRSLLESVATTDEELTALEAQQRGEPAEGAARGVAEDVLNRLGGRERHELDEIDAAQHRLESGAFGACEACHRAIPVARLRAVPAARCCARCQEQVEADGRARPR